MPGESSDLITGLPSPARNLDDPDHDWEPRTRSSKVCRLCGAVSIESTAGGRKGCVYAARGQAFEATPPPCASPGEIYRACEEDTARIREALWAEFNKRPGSIELVERALLLPEGYFRQSAMSGQIDLSAILGALVRLGIEPGGFFARALKKDSAVADA